MLSFVLRRARLRLPGTFRVVQRLPTHAVLSNQRLTLTFQKNFATTTNNRNKESTPSVEPEPEPKSKPRSTRTKKTSSAKVEGKRKVKNVKREVEKTTETEQKVTITNSFGLWFSEWSRSQPKIEGRPNAHSRLKEGSLLWKAVSDHEKEQYRERANGLRAEYKKHLEEWRGTVDPTILKEMNRRRVANGKTLLSKIFSFSMDVRREYPGTETDPRARFNAVNAWIGSQWKAMSDTEKAKYTDPAEADFAAWREKRGAESQAKLNG
ncbi:hypothetical protein BC826DRAFT_1039132 [Russula brevipes]|nr:hypothetical protein BC826DRAFT_1039132 [Russula brevipes]